MSRKQWQQDYRHFRQTKCMVEASIILAHLVGGRSQVDDRLSEEEILNLMRQDLEDQNPRHYRHHIEVIEVRHMMKLVEKQLN